MGDHPVAERHLQLAGEPQAAGAARRAVRELLAETGHEDWRDAAELAVSEIVTNAVLHGRTGIDLAICVQPDQIRVEVIDTSPRLPVARGYALDATTGRGLALVEQVTTAYGVERVGTGKLVWFCIGGGPAADAAV